jgi:hypothetical protein
MPLDDEYIDWANTCAGMAELELRLPKGFVSGLLGETDWAFVIRLNAVFESLLNAAISRLLVAVHPNGLEEVITKLDMADVRRGKVVIAAELELIGSEEKGFLRGLAELRNGLAHSVANLGFEFPAWLSLLTSDQRKEWAKKFSVENDYGPGQTVTFEDDPKGFIFCGAVGVIERITCSMPPAATEHVRRMVRITLEDAYRFVSDGSSKEPHSDRE